MEEDDYENNDDDHHHHQHQQHHRQNYEDDLSYYQSPPTEDDEHLLPATTSTTTATPTYYHSYPAASTISGGGGGMETRNYGNFTVTVEENNLQTPTEIFDEEEEDDDERYESTMERYQSGGRGGGGGYASSSVTPNQNQNHHHYNHNQTESDEEYDAEMEDYLPPEPSGRPLGQMYDSEGDYSLPQRRYDNQSGASSTTVERRYDSGSEYTGMPIERRYDSGSEYAGNNSRIGNQHQQQQPDIYQYDSSEYPSTVEAKYPPPPIQPAIIDKNYAAQLAALERRYDSYTSDDAGTSTSIFSHDSKNPRNIYMAEEGVNVTTPTPTEDFPTTTNGPITTEFEYYQNESYVDPVDIRHPPDYEPLSYNSRPPGGQQPIRRRSSSILSPTNEPFSPPSIMQNENSSNISKPLNGYLPNGYGNNTNNFSETIVTNTNPPTTTTSSSVFPMMSQQQTQQSQIQRRVSEAANEQQEQPQKSRNSFDLSPNPHDYEKEYAVYNTDNNIQQPSSTTTTFSPDSFNNKQTINNFRFDFFLSCKFTENN
uniref:Uncharacterized protein n=1 Tax=Panagrolaimus superbus TaxID=310955 RepID=A0A914XRP1_9BILA